MDFAFNDDQANLRDLATRIFTDASNEESQRSREDRQGPWDQCLWKTLGEAGLLGLAVPHAHGGLGLGFMDLAILLEEQGRTLAQVPVHASLVTGGLALARFGSPEQQLLLEGVASGEVILTAALEEGGNPDPASPMLEATPIGGGWSLYGVKTAVPYGKQANRIIVPARAGSGPGADIIVFLLDPASAGVTLTRQESTSAEPQAELRLDQVFVTDGDILGQREQGQFIANWILDRARTGLAAIQLGICAEALRRTAAYSSERVQFGRPLGSMQAVQHRIADGFIDVEAMRSTMLRAAWLLDEEWPSAGEVETAKYWAALGGHRVSHSAQHLHGGIGADIDYPIHRYFLAAKQVEQSLGGAQPMLAAIGREIASGNAALLAGERA